MVNRYLRILLSAMVLSLSGAVLAGGPIDSDSIKPAYQYTPVDNPLAEVQKARQRAIDNDKPLLVVLGANWCHDSRGLAQSFSLPEVDEVLAREYETVFVDVGYYEDRRDVTMALGYPGYFATPSVFVVREPLEPSPDLSTLMLFQSADSVPVETYLQTLSRLKAKDTPPPFFPDSAQGETVLTVSQSLTDRLQNGFDVIGPLLRKDVEKGAADIERLNALWKEVRAFRMDVQSTLHEMSAHANHRTLSPGDYSPPEKQSWER